MLCCLLKQHDMFLNSRFKLHRPKALDHYALFNLQNSTGMCCIHFTMVLDQPRVSSKEGCLYACTDMAEAHALTRGR